MSRLVVVIYDIADDTRRRRVAEHLLNYGERAGLSVSECHLDNDRVKALEAGLRERTEEQEDRVCVYFPCIEDARKRALQGRARATRDWDYRLA